MVTFLTSSPTRECNEQCPEPVLDERNGFLDRLAEVWPEEARCLMIAASPEEYDSNDEMTGFYAQAVENAGFPVACFDLWDARCPGLSQEELRQYDVIFLAGGHVPTQRQWFEQIGLREGLEGYPGVVVGTSAGSMNAAQEVYAWPELEGESEDPDYALFFPGLGLAQTQVLPHYQKAKNNWLDGKKLVDEIACGHSYGRRFFAILDGSFVVASEEGEWIYGESWLIADGVRRQFTQDGECRNCAEE